MCILSIIYLATKTSPSLLRWWVDLHDSMRGTLPKILLLAEKNRVHWQGCAPRFLFFDVTQVCRQICGAKNEWVRPLRLTCSSNGERAFPTPLNRVKIYPRIHRTPRLDKPPAPCNAASPQASAKSPSLLFSLRETHQNRKASR